MNIHKYLRVALIFTLIFTWVFSGFPQVWQNPPFPPKIKEARAQTVTFILQGTTSFNVPSDWNDSDNSIETIGGGGGGASSSGAGGGGGGGYSIESNVVLTPSTTVTVQVGAGGAAGSAGTDTFFCNSNSNCADITGTAVVSGAKAGEAGTATAGGAGGLASAGVGTTKNNGGTGGDDGTQDNGGGGGGAGGTNGAGAAGGNGDDNAGGDDGGGGGGGSGGGTAGGNGGANGGAGGDNFGATGGGAKGQNADGGAGSDGGGGGGGDEDFNGGVGGAGTEFDSSHGSGGGGGGGGRGTSRTGAAGGNYGAGGGGGDTGGAGADGLIVVTYTVAAAAGSTLEQVVYRWFANDDSTDVGNAGGYNTPIIAPPEGTPIRLRLLFHVAGADLASSGTTTKMQVGEKPGGGCSSATFADVSGTTDITWIDNSTPADEAALTSNAEDPRHAATTSSHAVINQNYNESNNFTNSRGTVDDGAGMLFDFSFSVSTTSTDISAKGGKTYCFRAVQEAGGSLAQDDGGGYTVYPELSIEKPIKIRLRGAIRLRVVRLR